MMCPSQVHHLWGYVTPVCLITGNDDHDDLGTVVSAGFSYCEVIFPFTINKCPDGYALRLTFK